MVGLAEGPDHLEVALAVPEATMSSTAALRVSTLHDVVGEVVAAADADAAVQSSVVELEEEGRDLELVAGGDEGGWWDRRRANRTQTFGWKLRLM